MLCSRCPFAPFVYSIKPWIVWASPWLLLISQPQPWCLQPNAIDHSRVGDTYQRAKVPLGAKPLKDGLVWFCPVICTHMELPWSPSAASARVCFSFPYLRPRTPSAPFIASCWVVSSWVCMKWVWSGLGHRFHGHSERNGTATPVLKELFSYSIIF